MIGSLLNQRYELLELLGEGGMAVVYRVRDHRSGDEIALKAMKLRLDGTFRKRFAREFGTISAIQHPHCVRVFDFGETTEFPFFTMELVAGRPIGSLYGQSSAVRFEAIAQAAAAIDYIHQRGIIHRDIKPSNVLACLPPDAGPNAPTVDVKLMDFGLARFSSAPTSLTLNSGFLGTLRYCAPEQINSANIDHRADLYALGMVCYELLTGVYPFREAAEGGCQSLIRAQFTQSPEPMRRHQPDLPGEVEEIVMSLLTKDPAQRPSSAASLRHAVLRSIGPSAGSESEARAGGEVPAAVLGTRLVGREAELSILRQVLPRALSPRSLSASEWTSQPIPSIVFLTGEAGLGKSRLLEEAHRIARERGANVYHGRCFEGNLAPFQPFVEVIQQILLEVRTAGPRPAARPPAESLRSRVLDPTGPINALDSTSSRGDQPGPTTAAALVEDYTAEMLRIAPDLHRWLPGEAFRQSDLSRETNYVLRAIAQFFGELSVLHGTCLSIEDLQWADQGTLDLLRHVAMMLFRNRELSVDSNLSFPRLLVVCTARPGDGRVDALIREMAMHRQAIQLPLANFSRTEMADYVATLVGERAAERVEKLIAPLDRWCQGNPLFMAEVVRDWIASGRIVRFEDSWVVAADATGADTLPQTIREVLHSRMRTLSREAGQILAVAAVVGPKVDIEVLRQACDDVKENDFLDALDELLAARPVFESGSGTRLEFAHDSIREQVYEEISSSRRCLLHRRIGEILEERRSEGKECLPETLAVHFSAAGVSGKAVGYRIEAAEAALAAYAIDDAIGHLEAASHLATASLPAAQRYRVNELLATAYGAVGKATKAIELYQQNLDQADDRLVRATLQRKLGELHFRVGDFDAAIPHFDAGLKELGRRRPRSDAVAALLSGVQLVRHFWPPWLSLPRRLAGAARERAIAIRRIWHSSGEMWAQRSMMQCGHAHLRELVLAQRLGDPSTLAQAYGEHTLLSSIFSLNWLALRAGRRAMEYAAVARAPEVEAIVRGFLGCAHYYGARLRTAEALLRESLDVLDRHGDSWHRQFFYHNLRHTYSILGDSEKEISIARVEIDIGQTVRDAEGSCWGMFGMANALARSGKLDEAREWMQKAREQMSPANIIVRPTVLHTQGFLHLQAGDYPAAREVLAQSRSVMERHFAYVDYAVRVYPLLIESLLGPHWHDPQKAGDAAATRCSWGLLARGIFWARRFPNYLPHMLRVVGRMHAARGRTSRARRHFSEAIAMAEEIGARYDLARSYLDRAKLDCADVAEDHRRGLAVLADLNASVADCEL